MNTNLFTVFILSLTCGMTYFYAELREHFNPLDQYKEKVARLEDRVKEERFKHLRTSYEFQDFRQHVATLMPAAIKEKNGDSKKPSEKSFTLRSLASVVQKGSNENFAYTRAKLVFEEGQRQFRENHFENAVNSFELLVKNHPYSANIPEALFLLVESYFHLNQYDRCTQAANKMLDLYPENELTGYAMLRLGKVYEHQDRHTEAIEIYKTVMKSFPHRDLAGAANASLRAVEL